MTSPLSANDFINLDDDDDVKVDALSPNDVTSE